MSTAHPRSQPVQSPASQLDESSATSSPDHVPRSIDDRQPPGECPHPLEQQVLETIDAAYARSCQCGVVLDAWPLEASLEAGLARLAAQRGSTIDRVTSQVTIDL